MLTYGDTPDDEAIDGIVALLEQQGHGAEVFQTDSLGSICPLAAGLERNASGLLAMPIGYSTHSLNDDPLSLAG